jgi:hypothetical protein
MKRSVLAVVVAVLVFSGVSVFAQSESFVGVVKAVNGSSVTVERGSITGVFSFDSKTHIGVKGATAKTAEAKAAGKPGATGPDLIHVGDQVKVSYTYASSTNKMVVGDITVTESLAPKK